MRTFFVVSTVDGKALDWWQFDTYERALTFCHTLRHWQILEFKAEWAAEEAK